MRGIYSATYLSSVANSFARKRGVPQIDIGAAFDLIVGTSTGGILACALAVGIPLDKVVRLYRLHGRAIFPLRVPKGIGPQLVIQKWSRPPALKRGAAALRAGLTECFGNTTLGDVYAARHIALAITAVEMSQHRSWVFKTQHVPNSIGRDNCYTLVDVCMATTAAPIYRSLSVGNRPDGAGSNVFADGGLWANNPVLVALIDALAMAPAGRPIEVFSIGTCQRPAGEQVKASKIDRGLGDWKFGSEAAGLSIDAQEFAFDHMAQMLKRHFNRPCEIVRFPREQIPAALMPYLELDDTRTEAMDALVNQAQSDADMTNSRCSSPGFVGGELICRLFTDAPARQLISGGTTQSTSEPPESQTGDS